MSALLAFAALLSAAATATSSQAAADAASAHPTHVTTVEMSAADTGTLAVDVLCVRI
jgi:hypothetical protein